MYRLKRDGSGRSRINGQPAPTKEDILHVLDQFGDKRNHNDNESLVIIEDAPKGDQSMDSSDDLESTSLNKSYCGEWEKLFTKLDYMRTIQSYGLKGKLRSTRFRSVCWRLYLGVLKENRGEWLQRTRDSRKNYTDLKLRLLINPRKSMDDMSDLSLNNPLSQATESPWNQFFQDNELRVTITQDVIRTYPKIEFFHTDVIRSVMVDALFVYAKLYPDISYRQSFHSSTYSLMSVVLSLPGKSCCSCCKGSCSMTCQAVTEPLDKALDHSTDFPEIEFFQNPKLHETLLDILFCYARSHPLSYKQGMHELLAPLIFVLHCDHQAFLHACEIESVEDIVKELLDPEYLEHDAYAMFCQVMETVEPWYISREISPVKTPPGTKGSQLISSQPFSRPQDLNPSNVIVTKLTRIQDYILKKYDPELHGHLERLEIAPQIYGIRWVRLLFGREFPMQDLLVIWDAIFADGISFDLVDYIFVSMLMYIRNLLITSDYPSCLTCLMRYPPVGDVLYFVQKALYLREPNQQPRPPNYTYQKLHSTNIPISRPERPQRGSSSNIAANVISGLTTLTRRMGRPRTLQVDGQQKISKSTSEPMNLQTDQSPEPYPGTVYTRKGSTASLSKLEDRGNWWIRPTVSSQSLARLENGPGSRSGMSTPGGSTTSLPQLERGSPEEKPSPPEKYATLPSRGKKAKKGTKMDREMALQQDVCYLQGQVNDMEAMCRYCASKMDIHIDKLQYEMLRQGMEHEDELLLALAGLKQIRDVLKGTLRFSSNILDFDEIQIRDNYYKEELSRHTSGSERGSPSRSFKKRGVFYMGSTETSSGNASPENPEPIPEHSKHLPTLQSHLLNKAEIELPELESQKVQPNGILISGRNGRDKGRSHSSPPSMNSSITEDTMEANPSAEMPDARRRTKPPHPTETPGYEIEI